MHFHANISFALWFWILWHCVVCTRFTFASYSCHYT